MLPVASGSRTRSEAIRLIARRKTLFAITLLLELSATTTALALPAFLGLMVDTVIDDRPNSLLGWYAAAIVGCGVVGAALAIAARIALSRLAETALAELREEVFETAVAQPLADIEHAGLGDVVARVSSDVEVVKEAISNVLPTVTSALFTLALTLAAMATLDWRFALAAALPAPLQILTARWFARRSGKVYSAHREAEAARGQQVLESVSGASTLAALGIGAHHEALISRSSIAVIDLQVKAMRLITGFFNRLNLAELMGLTTVLVMGFLLVDAGLATIGAATAAALYFHRLFDPISVLLGEVDELIKAGSCLSRLFGVTMLRAPALDEPVSTSGDASIRVERVSYSYEPHTRAVDHLSLDVPSGDRIALVGASGAGKTTLARLIAGVQPPGEGSIYIGGTDIMDLDPVGLRQHVAMISQEARVFSGTLAEDLRLGAPSATDAELEDALAVVEAKWVDSLPHGLDTPIGVDGHNLGPDQVQQVALARLLLKDPMIAVLDEATAEAGTTSARILDRATERVVEGRTAVVVAHRLSQAVIADRIVVMDGGRITEQGTHDELLAADGDYARLWMAWTQPRSTQSL